MAIEKIKESVQKPGATLGEGLEKAVGQVMDTAQQAWGTYAKTAVALSGDQTKEAAIRDLRNSSVPDIETAPPAQEHGLPAANFEGAATPDLDVQQGLPADTTPGEPGAGPAGTPTLTSDGM